MYIKDQIGLLLHKASNFFKNRQKDIDIFCKIIFEVGEIDLRHSVKLLPEFQRSTSFHFREPELTRIALEKGSGWEKRGRFCAREENGRELYTRISLSLMRARSEVYGTSCKAHAPGERYNSRWSSQLLDSWTDIWLPATFQREYETRAIRRAARLAVTPRPRNVPRDATRVMSCRRQSMRITRVRTRCGYGGATLSRRSLLSSLSSSPVTLAIILAIRLPLARAGCVDGHYLTTRSWQPACDIVANTYTIFIRIAF